MAKLQIRICRYCKKEYSFSNAEKLLHRFSTLSNYKYTFRSPHYCSEECRRSDNTWTCQFCDKQFVDYRHKNRTFCSLSCKAKLNAQHQTREYLKRAAKIPDKHCLYCGKPIRAIDFATSHAFNVTMYCSKRCKPKHIHLKTLEQRSIPCPICGTKFVPERHRRIDPGTKQEYWVMQKYCSRPCSNKGRTKSKETFTCLTCGRVVEKTRNTPRIRKYCSPRCIALATARFRTPQKKKTSVCQHCGKLFEWTYTKQHKLRRQKPRKFCNKECHRANRKLTMQTHVCETCGREFIRTTNVFIPRYCSPKCVPFHKLISIHLRECIHCKKTFRPDNDHQLYCSFECFSTVELGE